ncbi:hypothetical protein LCGC14_1799420 [marine sediment metagenome]|uniref:Uncharacterized protein n=1 Tax=marine sediment metagenome TaxID=412755 RepID=A0A0F9JPR1_9ZZZZ
MNYHFKHLREYPGCYEDCPDTDACPHTHYGGDWEFRAAAVNRNLAQAKLERLLSSKGVANGTADNP